MVKKEFYNYSDYESLLNELVTKLKNDSRMKYIRNVYGIPRGGLPIAVHLSHFLKLNFLTNPFEKMIEETIIVDDIADTGLQLYSINLNQKLSQIFTLRKLEIGLFFLGKKQMKFQIDKG